MTNHSVSAVSAMSVVGLGSWGTALANHLALKGLDVLGWCKEPDIATKINSSHHNPIYLSSVQLDPKLKATNDLSAALRCEIVVVAVPSAVLHLIVPKLTLSSQQVVVSAIKGLDPESLLTPLQLLGRAFPQLTRLCVLSGPSFAKDVVAKRPAGLVAAAKDDSTAQLVAKAFSSEWMKVYVSTDPLGVELGGIVKNVIAVAVGVADGLGLGDSARAGLVTRGLAEMMRFAESQGAETQTLCGLSGLGDLVMTATCDTSRNRTVGLRLGRGESLAQILSTLETVAEGVKTTPLVLALGRRAGVDMPITEQVDRLLRGEITAQEMAKNLLTRPTRKEF